MSTSVVLPIPGSPVTKTTCRLPADACCSALSSISSGATRPTHQRWRPWAIGASACRCSGGRSTSEEEPRVTGARSRYPRRVTVSIYWGACLSSPKADRSAFIATLRLDSLTCRLVQTASSNSSFVTNSPARSTRQHNTSNGFGANTTRSFPRRSRAFARSSRNGPNATSPVFTAVGPHSPHLTNHKRKLSEM